MVDSRGAPVGIVARTLEGVQGPVTLGVKTIEGSGSAGGREGKELAGVG